MYPGDLDGGWGGEGGYKCLRIGIKTGTTPKVSFVPVQKRYNSQL
jgi:hypothetical protein